MRRARRAVRNSLRSLEQSTGRLEQSERRRGPQPRAAMRQLRQAHGSLTRAAEHLARASVRMKEAMQSLARAPQEGRGAPAAIIELTRIWIQLTSRVAATSNRIDHASALIGEAARSRGLDIPDAIDAVDVARWQLMVTRRYGRPWLLLLDLPSLRQTVARVLFPRRRRPAPPAVAEGVSQVCRGRAPPRPSICTL